VNRKPLFPQLPTWGEDETLNAVLDRLGLERRKTINGKRAIIFDGRQVFDGRAGDVWEWLRKGCPVAEWFPIPAEAVLRKAGVR
jgi:hypothetical protein